MIGIYKITSPSGKIYVGQSWNIEKRFFRYKSLACKAQCKLYASFKKYGVKNHIFEYVEILDSNICEVLKKRRKTAGGFKWIYCP